MSGAAFPGLFYSNNFNQLKVFLSGEWMLQESLSQHDALRKEYNSPFKVLPCLHQSVCHTFVISKTPSHVFVANNLCIK